MQTLRYIYGYCYILLHNLPLWCMNVLCPGGIRAQVAGSYPSTSKLRYDLLPPGYCQRSSPGQLSARYRSRWYPSGFQETISFSPFASACCLIPESTSRALWLYGLMGQYIMGNSIRPLPITTFDSHLSRIIFFILFMASGRGRQDKAHDAGNGNGRFLQRSQEGW